MGIIKFKNEAEETPVKAETLAEAAGEPFKEGVQNPPPEETAEEPAAAEVVPPARFGDESVALQAPGVQTCLVYGKDDVNYGQEICIKAVGSLTAQDLRKYLLERLPARLMPGRFEIVDRLDMTPSGKIRR